MQPANRLTVGASGGPCILATARFRRVWVISPLNHFMVSSANNRAFDSTADDSRSEMNSVSSWGTVATVAEVNAGFTHRIMIHQGSGGGLTSSVHEWGQQMQSLAGTRRIKDLTLRKLGYSTDNGAMYCYCTEHCDTKLLAVKAAWDGADIPMAYLTFEGRWFTSNWSAMWCVSDLRPNEKTLDLELATFVERLGVPIHGYLPYFCTYHAVLPHLISLLDTEFTSTFRY